MIGLPNFKSDNPNNTPNKPGKAAFARPVGVGPEGAGDAATPDFFVALLTDSI